MNPANRRITHHRRYVRLLDALKVLEQNGVLMGPEVRRAVERAQDLKQAWREEREKSRPADARPRGRPRNEATIFEKCQYRFGCMKAPKPGQKYCCADHAPYGAFGMDHSA